MIDNWLAKSSPVMLDKNSWQYEFMHPPHDPITQRVIALKATYGIGGNEEEE